MMMGKKLLYEEVRIEYNIKESFEQNLFLFVYFILAESPFGLVD
jgi:hypothetical protein